MADFVAAFRDAIDALGYTEAPERRLTLAERVQLAEQRAGTTDKKSTAYKNAMRFYQRRVTTAGQARAQPNRRFAQELRRRGLQIHAELELDPSPDPANPDFRPRTIDVQLTGAQLAETATALARGEVDEAASEFASALLGAYGGGLEELDLTDDVIGEVETLDFEWLRQ